jgi:hypothetical protein
MRGAIVETRSRARYGPPPAPPAPPAPELVEVPLPVEVPVPVEVLVPVPVEVLVPVPVEVLVPVPVEVLVPAEVVAAADVVAPAVASTIPPSSLLPIWQFGFSLAPLGQQMSELPPRMSFDVQNRSGPQSSLPVVGSLGVAAVLRSQRWPSPWRPQPGAVRTNGRVIAVAARSAARIA